MKKTLILLLSLFIFSNIYAENTFTVYQGVSFIENETRAVTDNNKYYRPGEVKNLFAEYTKLSANISDIVLPEVTVQFGKDYQNINCSITLQKSITDNITPFVKGNFKYTNCNIFNDVYGDSYIGISSKNNIGFVTLDFSGYIGYVFADKVTLNKTISSDNKNSFITGFEAAVEMEFKNNINIRLYAGIESFQIFMPSEFVFWPNEINNTIGASFKWTSNSGFCFFADIEHFCLHPEKPWHSINTNYYNSEKTVITVGVSFAFGNN
jgi:hypothetical protein